MSLPPLGPATRSLLALLALGWLNGCTALVQVPESSGLAPSAAGFWTLNDGRNADGSGGESRLYEWRDGRVVRTVTVAAPNRDWEDLDRFRHGATDYLLIADVGDNGARRDEVQLYLIPEPAAGAEHAEPVRTIRFRYPGGPRDAEAVAVVPGTWSALVVSKRDQPPQLFAVDLTLPERVQDARHLGSLGPIPAPGFSARLWPLIGRISHQPTGLAIAPDNRLAVISTYDDAWLFRRDDAETWAAALARAPRRIELPDLAVYEGIALRDGYLYVSQERLDGVIRVPLPARPAP